MNDYLDSVRLDRLAIWWSLMRMVLVASILLFGYVPLLGGLSFMAPFVPWLWMVSGLVSIYLAYRWFVSDMKLLNETDILATAAFWLMIISGLNLGLASFGDNFGMAIVADVPMSDLILKAVGVAYLLSVGFLYRKWSQSGLLFFDNAPAKTPEAVVQKVTPPEPVTKKPSFGPVSDEKEEGTKVSAKDAVPPSVIRAETALSKPEEKKPTPPTQQTLADSMDSTSKVKESEKSATESKLAVASESQPAKSSSDKQMNDETDLKSENKDGALVTSLSENKETGKPPVSLEKRIEEESKSKSF